MKGIKALACSAAIATTIAVSFAHAATDNKKASFRSFTSTQQKDLGRFVNQYIMDHPEVIVNAIKKMQVDERIKQRQALKQAVIDNINQLRNPQANTVVGNKNAKVTMVEFFDYQCGMCVRANAGVKEVMKDNNNLRVVFNHMPIFGKVSNYSARMDVVAANQGKYDQFHRNMFAAAAKGRLKEADVRKVAKNSGVKLNKQILSTFNKGKVNNVANKNLELARKLNLTGTPMFAIFPTTGPVTEKNVFVFPGAVPPQALQAAIDVVSGKRNVSTANKTSSRATTNRSTS